MFCWRGDVAWKIATEPSLKDLSHVDSDEFILAIPDFTKEPVETDDYIDHENSFHSSRSLSHDRSRNAVFGKVIMKLNGGVRWIAGLVFERRCPPNCGDCQGRNRCRRFNFIPHHEVHLKKAECCHSTNGEVSRFTSKLTKGIRQLPRVQKRFYARVIIDYQSPRCVIEGWM